MTGDPIEAAIRESIATKERLVTDGLGPIRQLLERAEACLRGGGRLFFCGNGGSSCDAAHAACELVGWFLEKDRAPLAAIALGQETPTASAISNDAGYEQVFARQLQALGRAGDLLVGISTSASSKNVLLALETAKQMGIYSVALTGANEGPCATAADLWVPIPSTETPRIQESHLLTIHLLCDHLEQQFS